MSSLTDGLLELTKTHQSATVISPKNVRIPINFDLLYNATLLFLAARTLGKRIVNSPEEQIQGNIHLLKFGHFVCARPEVLISFEAWDTRNSKRLSAPGDTLFYRMPRGFLTNSSFDSTVSYLRLLGEATLAKKNITISADSASLFGRIMEACDKSLFSEQVHALQRLKKLRVSQKKLGIS